MYRIRKTCYFFSFHLNGVQLQEATRQSTKRAERQLYGKPNGKKTNGKKLNESNGKKNQKQPEGNESNGKKPKSNESSSRTHQTARSQAAIRQPAQLCPNSLFSIFKRVFCLLNSKTSSTVCGSVQPASSVLLSNSLIRRSCQLI